MKSLATIFALAAIAIPAAYAAQPQPMSDVQLSRPSISKPHARVNPLSDVQLSRPPLAQQHAVTPAPISDVQLSRDGSRTTTPVLVAAPNSGFAWADASIAAAVTLGLLLLAVATALHLRKTRRRIQRA